MALASGGLVRHCPSMLYFIRNGRFRADRFFQEPTFNFGNNEKIIDIHGNKGGRSIMLIALKILYYVGIRKVYLLGCDFKMTTRKPYADDIPKADAGVRSNNDKFKMLDQRFGDLWRYAYDLGFEIINCTEGSHLTAFPRLSYEEALRAHELI
jgi:hypothetical protein